MREAKRKRDEDKKKKMDQLDIGIQPGKTHIDHEIIDRILRDEDPFTPAEQQKDAAENNETQKEELKVSTFVVDLQIPAPVSLFILTQRWMLTQFKILVGKTNYIRSAGSMQHY